jgi:lysophospholipase L1-like esterase
MIRNWKKPATALAVAILALAALSHAMWAQERALLSGKEALALCQRVVDLIESTAVAVPSLSRASAPVFEETRQALAALKETNQQNSGQVYTFLTNARSYIALADTVPKPYPFPETAQSQFQELRIAIDRLDTHFRALLVQKEAQIRSPDRDNIRRYSEANQKVPAPAQDKLRVVFLGDSITDGWRLNEYFGDRDFVNRGISGQITGEMLGRMQEDVIALKPKAMLVLAGTNDIARGISLRTIEDNLGMIADLAQFHGIQPFFASVLPISDYHRDVNPSYAQSKVRSPNAIRELNDWLLHMCVERHFIYVDYYTAMVDQAGWLPADMADDGLHPNAKGYRVMAPIVLAALDKMAAKAPPPAKNPKEKPVKTARKQPARQPAAQPPAQPATQTATQPAPQPAAQPVPQSATQTAAQPVPQSVAQPADQPAAPTVPAATATAPKEPKKKRNPFSIFTRNTSEDKPQPPPQN